MKLKSLAIILTGFARNPYAVSGRLEHPAGNKKYCRLENIGVMLCK